MSVLCNIFFKMFTINLNETAWHLSLMFCEQIDFKAFEFVCVRVTLTRQSDWIFGRFVLYVYEFHLFHPQVGRVARSSQFVQEGHLVQDLPSDQLGRLNSASLQDHDHLN